MYKNGGKILILILAVFLCFGISACVHEEQIRDHYADESTADPLDSVQEESNQPTENATEMEDDKYEAGMYYDKIYMNEWLNLYFELPSDMEFIEEKLLKPYNESAQGSEKIVMNAVGIKDISTKSALVEVHKLGNGESMDTVISETLDGIEVALRDANQLLEEPDDRYRLLPRTARDVVLNGDEYVLYEIKNYRDGFVTGVCYTSWTLFREQDGYVVSITLSTKDFEDTIHMLDPFVQPYKPEKYTPLDYRKAWRIPMGYEGNSYSWVIIFEENNSFSSILIFGEYEPIDCYKGEYEIDGCNVSLIFDDQSMKPVVYEYDGNDVSFRQISESGLFKTQKAGDIFLLIPESQENTDRIRQLAVNWQEVPDP